LVEAHDYVGRRRHQAACTTEKVRSLTGARVEMRQARATQARERQVIRRRAELGLSASAAPPLMLPAPSVVQPVLIAPPAVPVPVPVPAQLVLPRVHRVRPPNSRLFADNDDEEVANGVQAVHIDDEAEEVDQTVADAEDADDDGANDNDVNDDGVNDDNDVNDDGVNDLDLS